MQRQVQITFKDIPHSEAIETSIREKMAKLETFYSHIIGAHVTIEMPHRHKQQGKLHNVRLELKVPGSEIIVNRDSHEDLYVALRDTFDAAKRQLDGFVQRQRGDVKNHTLPAAKTPEETGVKSTS